MEENIQNEYLDANYRLFQALTERIVFYKKYWAYYSSATDPGDALSEPAEIEFEPVSDSMEVSFRKEMAQVAKSAKKIEAGIALIALRAKRQGVTLELETICRKYNLTKKERYIVIALFFSFLEPEPGLPGHELLNLFCSSPAELFSESLFLHKGGSLRRNNIIRRLRNAPSILGDDFILDDQVFDRIIGKEDPLELSQSWRERSSYRGHGAMLIVRDPEISFDRVVMNAEAKEELERALWRVDGSRVIFEDWGFKTTIRSGRAVSMLFYGPPGTGKTMTAEAVAHKLGKKIGIADYARMQSKWWGNSEKNVRAVFQDAARNDCVLVFDEADALFGGRLDEHSSNDRTYNYMTNLLMQEMDRFEGVVILTSNREFALDRAFERRIVLKLCFDLPSAAERARIWASHLPDQAPKAPDIDFDELGRRFEISGGNIRNAMLNAAGEAAFLHTEITMAMLVRAAEKEKPVLTGQNRKIGFQTV